MVRTVYSTGGGQGQGDASPGRQGAKTKKDAIFKQKTGLNSKSEGIVLVGNIISSANQPNRQTVRF